MLNLYILAGCNRTGETTAAYTILPEILNCREIGQGGIDMDLSVFSRESRNILNEYERA